MLFVSVANPIPFTQSSRWGWEFRLDLWEHWDLYRNNLKNRNFDEEAHQNFDLERATIAGRQGASENQNSGVKPTRSKTDSSGCFGIDLIAHLLSETDAPVMLTLRRRSAENESERLKQIQELLSLKPPYFDLEYDVDPVFLHMCLTRFPETKFVLSYHNFQETPDLESLYSSMQRTGIYSYKIAAMSQSTNDALRMLCFAKKHPDVSVICMGEKGEFARVLAPIVGNRVNYACLHGGAKTGPGQLSVDELMSIYHYDRLNEQTAIYGLIGDPVEKSPGHLHHNAVFRKKGCNAVYVKMQVKPEELAKFIPLAKELGIRGLSVTIPLKEKILHFVDVVDRSAQSIGALNTLKFEEGKIFGTNTDGNGALDAIEKKASVRGKKVVLLGAGGAARAIAFEAKKRGADVILVNRTASRAEALAKELGCRAGQLPDNYDVLINCSPVAEEKILPGTIAMDVVYAPKDTPFLQEAARKNCQIVYGEEMYLNQAAGQTQFWL